MAEPRHSDSHDTSRENRDDRGQMRDTDEHMHRKGGEHESEAHDQDESMMIDEEEEEFDEEDAGEDLEE
ncbi:MAG TPA: hypothetical protein VIC33_05400 [Vicinamibacterales bacterium]